MKITILLSLGCLLAFGAEPAGVRVFGNTTKGRVDCESPGRFDLTGSVLHADQNSFALDLCLPTQDCSTAIRADFSASGIGFAGFNHYLKPAGFIHVNIAVERLEGNCVQQITVASVASWMGARNPSGSGSELYFAAGEGTSEPPAGSEFALARCVDGNRTLGLTIGKTRVTLRTGPAREFTLNNAKITARLLSAGSCGSARGWSYWLAGSPVQ